MSDSRHKKSPPSDPEERVTDELRSAARAALENNARSNRLRKKKKGETGYLISNQAELAEAIDADKTTIKKILGGARESTKVELTDRSAYVARIRKALDLPEPTLVSVPKDRLDALRWIADLPDEKWSVFRAEYERAMKRLDDR